MAPSVPEWYPLAAVFPRILIAFALLVFARPAQAQGGLRPDGHLDTAALRDAFLQSDIPMVRGTLEGFMKAHPKEVGRDERIFTHLYLGAIYAGETGARALAVGHFRSLLKLDPGHDPAAMYFTPGAQALFEEARSGLAREKAVSAPGGETPRGEAASAASSTAPPRNAPQTAAAPARASAATAPAPPRPAPAVAAREANRAWLWWTLGSAAAAVGAGVGVYALVQATSDPGPRRVDVDATLK